jgi:hypothetical protein
MNNKPAATSTGRSITLVGCMLMVTACSATPTQAVRTPEASRDLAKALAGYTRGQPVSCIPNNYSSTRMQIIDDGTILFRGNRTIYLQAPPGGCFGISSQLNTLVTRVWGTNQLCQGDINRLVDINTGIGGGSCVFGPFVPYTKSN